LLIIAHYFYFKLIYDDFLLKIYLIEILLL
jgi:hypothetical protein